MLNMNLFFNGIILYVSDVDNLKNFYVNFLNLKILEEIKSEWVLLHAGNCTLGLHKTGEQYQSLTEIPCETNTKIVFETTEDIYELRENILKSGIKITEINKFENYDFHFFDGEDPEGNVFQIRHINVL